MSDEIDELIRKAARNHLKAVPGNGTPIPKTVSTIAALPDDSPEPEWETWWLPEPVANWVEAAHAAFGVPRVMAIAAALCTAATLVQGRVRVRVKPGWEEPLSLFWIVFSPTGTLKSALLSSATRQVRAMQEEMARNVAPERHRIINKLKHLEAQRKGLTGKVSALERQEGNVGGMFGAAKEPRQLLYEVEHELANTKVPSAAHWLVDDINPSVLPKILRANLEAEGIARIAVLDAEGTFLANLLGRHSKHINADFLLKGYSGEAIDQVRASQNTDEPVRIHLPHSHVTLLQLVQPHYLDILKGHPSLADNGFMGRCLLTRLAPQETSLAWEAPSMPPEVQEAYDGWLWDVANVETGTVIDLFEDLDTRDALREVYAQLGKDRARNDGAAGWRSRALGRIARIIAIVELAHRSTDTALKGGVGRAGVPKKIILLYKYTYSLGKHLSQALEPRADPLATTTHRTLTWLRQSKRVPVGGFVTARELRRGLHLSVELAQAVCEELLDSGHFVVESEKRHRNKTVTVTYRVMSLDPNGNESPRPNTVPDPEDDGR